MSISSIHSFNKYLGSPYCVSLLLRNNAGAALNDGNGDYIALLVKDLSHTDFLTDKSLVHCVFPPVNYWLAGGTQSRSDIRVST